SPTRIAGWFSRNAIPPRSPNASSNCGMKLCGSGLARTAGPRSKAATTGKPRSGRCSTCTGPWRRKPERATFPRALPAGLLCLERNTVPDAPSSPSFLIRPAVESDAEALLDFYRSLGDDLHFFQPFALTLRAMRDHLEDVAEGDAISLV